MKVNDVLDDLDNLDAEGPGGVSQFNNKRDNGRGNSVTLPSMPKTGSVSKFSSWNSQPAGLGANAEKSNE